MKATGIVRRIDELGRVVIPKEIRRTQRIRRGDPLEIFTTGDGEVIFKKYSPMGEVNTLAAQLAEVLSRQFALTAFVCDRDRILAVSGSGRRELADRSISQPLEKLMEARKPYQSPGNPEKTLLPCEGAPRVLLCAAPVLAGGDVMAGASMLCFGVWRGRDRRGGAADRGPHRLPGGRPVQGSGGGSGLSGKADGGIRRSDFKWPPQSSGHHQRKTFYISGYKNACGRFCTPFSRVGAWETNSPSHRCAMPAPSGMGPLA